MATEMYGPVQQSVSNGVSQLFDYGIGMTALALFLCASVVLNVYLIRFYPKLLMLLGQIKELLDHDN
jgi:hypothetical protein